MVKEPKFLIHSLASKDVIFRALLGAALLGAMLWLAGENDSVARYTFWILLPVTTILAADVFMILWISSKIKAASKFIELKKADNNETAAYVIQNGRLLFLVFLQRIPATICYENKDSIAPNSATKKVSYRPGGFSGWTFLEATKILRLRRGEQCDNFKIY